MSRALACVLAAAWLAAACGDDPQIMQPAPPAIDSPEAVVTALVRAYRERDPDLLASLLANDPDNNAQYLFLLSEPSDTGETQWGYDEEARIHRRMFRPQQVDPGDTQVPAEYWLQSLSIDLTALEIFSERADLYSKDDGLDGKLVPEVWRAMDASYSANIFFDMAGDTNFSIEGTANFVVIENLQKNVGEAGKFLILVWEDIGSSLVAKSLDI